MTAGKGTAGMLVLCSALAVAATLVAQEQRLPTQPLQPGQPGQRREVNKPINEQPGMPLAANADSQLATCLLGGNQAEIALGKLAEQRAKDRDVKQFAEMMVRDHQQFVQQLERFARGNEEGRTVRAENRAVPGSAPVGLPPGAITGTGREPSLDGRGVNFVAIHEQVSKKCMELVEADLKQKDGAQFDRCYIGQQIGAHMHALAELEVLRSHVSSEFASVLDKAIETTKSHLEHAQKIAQALERS